MAVTIKKPDGTSQKPSPASKYAKHLQGSPGMAMVEVEKKSSTDAWAAHAATQETVHPSVTTNGQPAMVSIGGSRTFNLGNYESVKLTIHLAMPSDPDKIGETYNFVSNWVSERMTQAMKDAGIEK
jgi:hypothetical protein